MTTKFLLELLLILAGLIFGIVAVVESGLRNWAGWGVIALAVAALIMVWPA